MTIHIRTRKENKMQLNGNVLTGDTYPVKDYIKSKLGGKWSADAKAWIGDGALVNKWLDNGGTIYTDKDAANASAPAHTHTANNRDGFMVRKGVDGWCNKCHSYCYGDCDAN